MINLSNNPDYKYSEKSNCYIHIKKRKISAILSLLPMIIFSVLTFVVPNTIKLLFFVLMLVSCFISKKLLNFFDKKLNVVVECK